MYSSFIPTARTLMGPGPSDVNPRVLNAMARPTIGHLDPQFIRMMDEVKSLLQFAFQTKNELTIKLVKADKYTDEHTEQILKLMQTYVGSNVKLNLRFASQIPPTKSGKYRFIISKVPVKF